MSVNITYFLVLAAHRKVADLEIKIQEIEKNEKKHNHCKLLITIIFCSIQMECYTCIVNVS